MDVSIPNSDHSKECSSNRQLGALLYSRWNKNSTFLLGINYTKKNGDLWTSLSLKINIKKRLSESPRLSKSQVRIGEEAFLQIPLWLTEFLNFADFPINTALEKRSDTNCSMVYLCKENLHFSVFLKMFSVCILKNMSLYIYDENRFNNLRENLKLLPVSSVQKNGSLYLCEENELLEFMEKVA